MSWSSTEESLNRMRGVRDLVFNRGPCACELLKSISSQFAPNGEVLVGPCAGAWPTWSAWAVHVLELKCWPHVFE